MDKELKRLIECQGKKVKIGTEIKEDEVTMNFKQHNYKVKSIKELLEEKSKYNKLPSNEDDDFLPLLNNIEHSIMLYFNKLEIEDNDIIFALEELSKSPIQIPNDNLAKFIQANLRIFLSLRPHTFSELRWALNTVLRSVKRHSKRNGQTGYLDFIKTFVR